MKKKIIVLDQVDGEIIKFDSLDEAKEWILDCFVQEPEGIHPEIESVLILEQTYKIVVPENEDGTYSVNFVPIESLIIPKISGRYFDTSLNKMMIYNEELQRWETDSNFSE